MGADGGITITRVSAIKKRWPQIKADLIETFEVRGAKKDDWEKKYYIKSSEQAKALPDSVENLSGEEINTLLKAFESCDCPYFYSGFIITANGTNVPYQMEILSTCLGGLDIETWT